MNIFTGKKKRPVLKEEFRQENSELTDRIGRLQVEARDLRDKLSNSDTEIRSLKEKVRKSVLIQQPFVVSHPGKRTEVTVTVTVDTETLKWTHLTESEIGEKIGKKIALSLGELRAKHQP